MSNRHVSRPRIIKVVRNDEATARRFVVRTTRLRHGIQFVGFRTVGYSAAVVSTCEIRTCYHSLLNTHTHTHTERVGFLCRAVRYVRERISRKTRTRASRRNASLTTTYVCASCQSSVIYPPLPPQIRRGFFCRRTRNDLEKRKFVSHFLSERTR